MDKKLLVCVIFMMLLVSLTACGQKTCKVSGCDDAIYQDEYCKYHFTVHNADQVAKGIFDEFFG